MATFKKPPPGQDLSQTDLAASLEKDKGANVLGELDLGLDDDPDLRTRPGQKALLRREPARRLPVALVVAVVVLLGAAGAWIFGVLEAVGGPPPPAALSDALGLR
jgi:hypothetical protein